MSDPKPDPACRRCKGTGRMTVGPAPTVNYGHAYTCTCTCVTTKGATREQ